MDFSELLELFAAAGRDRELLRGLMRSAAELAQALSGVRLAEPPESALELPQWIEAYDTAATAANAPSAREWLGVNLSPFPLDPPQPWPVIAARYVQREPGIAAALRSAAQAYAAIAREGSAALQRLVSDAVIRRWAIARLGREQATGVGTGLQARGLAPASISPIPLIVGAGLGLIVLSKSKGSLLPIALLGGAALFLGSSSSNSSAPTSAARAATPGAAPVGSQQLPAQYAQGKRAQLLARWADVQSQHGSLGDALTVYAPRIFPEVPPVAFLGFTAIATSRTERTSANEVGYFQTPFSSYQRLAAEAATYLNREVLVAQWETDVEAQTVIGLLDLHAHLRALEALGFTAPNGSVWQVALAFAGFSAGTGGVNTAWGSYRAALERDSDPDARFGYLGSLIVEAWEDSRRALAPVSAHPNPAYTWLRTAQKIVCGRVCALELERTHRGEDYDSAWFPVFDEDIDALIVRASMGLVAEPPPPET